MSAVARAVAPWLPVLVVVLALWCYVTVSVLFTWRRRPRPADPRSARWINEDLDRAIQRRELGRDDPGEGQRPTGGPLA